MSIAMRNNQITNFISLARTALRIKITGNNLVNKC